MRIMTGDSLCIASRRKLSLAMVVCASAVGVAGCASPKSGAVRFDRAALKTRSLGCLRAALSYTANPVVRVEAVEALERCSPQEGRAWVDSAMHDEHPAVRFAACVAVGRLQYGTATAGVRRCLADDDPNVRVAALFSMHRLGDSSQTGKLAGYLLDHDEASVRRNAALVLGLLGEHGGTQVLARAMKDRDVGVRHHALEAMARLGTKEARQELSFLANTGVGAEEVFAINALAATHDPLYRETFRYKLRTAAHVETRLAAARGLGLLGDRDGLALALRSLRQQPKVVADPADPPAGQRLRVQLLAAAALGAIGHLDALPLLGDLLDEGRDPRVQVSAARAILMILEAHRERALPFGSTTRVDG